MPNVRTSFEKIYHIIFFFILFFSGTVSALDQEIEDIIEEVPKTPLFISLGSFCEPAHMLKFCGLRKRSFPFDWIISFDGEALIEILENGFKDFLNDDYFMPYGPAGHLLHTYYHLEFLHEGNFNQEYAATLKKLKEKYHRRIARFKHLKFYRGKVFFVRNANVYSVTDPHRFYKFEDNLEISEEYAMKLYQALKSVFPRLDFELIIINYGDGENIKEQKKLCEHVRIFRANFHWEQSKKIEKYKVFFNQLMNDAQIAP